MVANPAMWREREDEPITRLLVASPRNDVINDGRFAPRILARAMSYQRSRDPYDSDGKWLTVVLNVLNASRGLSRERTQ